MAIAFLGVDLAKGVFQLQGAGAEGQFLTGKRLRRHQLLPELAKLPPCLIGIEACTGAFFWQRQLEELGHTVRIIAPQYVKPFVKHQKSDLNDAETICTAMRQPNMKFMPTKNEEQQDIQAPHRVPTRLVNHRTALVSQMRGLLLERRVAISISITRTRRAISAILANHANGLTGMTREIIAEL